MRALAIILSFVLVVPWAPAAHAKRSQFWQGKKIKKTVAKVYKRKALSLLGLQQFTALSHTDQIRYIKTLRKAYALAETVEREIERRSGKGRKGAQLSPSSNEIWQMILFGYEAHAKIGDNIHPRTAGADCLYAGHIIESSTNSPYTCNGLQALGGGCSKGNSVPCNGMSYGISTCVQVKPGGRAPTNTVSLTSEACPDLRRLALDKLDVDNPSSAYNQALKKYKMSLKGDTKTKVALLARLKAIQDLKKFAVGDEAYVHMAKLAADFINSKDFGEIPETLDLFATGDSEKKVAVRETLLTFDKLTKEKGNLQSFLSNFDENVKKLDYLFFGIARYCYSTMDEDVKQGAMQESKNKEKNDAFDINAESCSMAQGEPRVKDCFARNECRFYVRDTDAQGNPLGRKEGRTIDILKSMDKIQRELEDINRGLPPIVTDNQVIIPVVTTQPNLPVVVDKVEVPKIYPRDPYEPIVSDGESFGCDNHFNLDPNMEPSPMACMMCSLERDKQVHDKNMGENAYQISPKWATLLNIATRFCGESTSTGKIIGPNSAVSYAQMFGHCSNDTYNWGDSRYAPATARLFQNVKDVDSLKKEEIQRFYKGTDDEHIGFGADESVNSYTDRALKELFGVGYKSKEVTVNQKDWGIFSFLTQKNIKGPGLDELFCPKEGSKALSTSEKIVHFEAKTREFDNYINELKLANREIKVQKSKDELAKHVRETSGLVACMKESLGNAKAMYHKEIIKNPPKGGGSKQAGCYVYESKLPKGHELSTDNPQVYFQYQGSNYNRCFTSFSKAVWKGDVEVLGSHAAPGMDIKAEVKSGNDSLFSVVHKNKGHEICSSSPSSENCAGMQYVMTNVCREEALKKANETGDWINYNSPYIDKSKAGATQ